MKLSDFDFALPTELIAQSPSSIRDYSNLLLVSSKNYVKTKFYEVLNYLKAGDVMVFNDSRVIKAKLLLDKGGKKIDFYLNKKVFGNCWRGFAKPAKKLKVGDEFEFGPHKVTISAKLDMGETEVIFSTGDTSIFEFGHIPLPPYIKRSDTLSHDDERYQTVYNNKPGSVAAPTAGLHFTQELIKQIKDKGVEIVYISLHVGAGTFLPVKTEDIDEHKMHSEFYKISQDAADVINLAKIEGRRMIAVGTTTLRTLESNAMKNGKIVPGEFETDIFIKPGFDFKIVDMLLTNFHLPKTTLFILVCTFAGYETILSAYHYAINEKMRFFSYGDAMLLTKK
jgi:S-adenosylmethionine:tRNA ribosyltransferase-isomerase